MEIIKVAIVGSRGFKDLMLVAKKVQELNDAALADGSRVIIVSGGARGVDTAAENAANALGMDTVIFKPDWNKYGKRAGFIRNVDIITQSDVVIAFWDGKSNGTRHDIYLAKEQGKPTTIIDEQGNSVSVSPEKTDEK